MDIYDKIKDVYENTFQKRETFSEDIKDLINSELQKAVKKAEDYYK